MVNATIIRSLNMLRHGALLAVLLVLVVLLQTNASAIRKRDAPPVKYTTRYDNVDISRIVASKRLMINYANCLLEKGPCTPEGKELKTYLPDAMQTNCVRCSDRQKEISGIVLAHLVQNYPDLWNQLLNKYDPDGSFRKQYEGGDEEGEDEEEEEDR